MARNFNDETAAEAISSGKPVMIDFWAEWCGPCRRVVPIVEELAQEYEGKVLIGKYNVDEGTGLAAEFGVRNIPTLLFFKDGQLVDRIVGAQPKAIIADKLQSLL